MATPPSFIVEEDIMMYEIVMPKHSALKPMPVDLDDLCRSTRFTRQEIRYFYRGLKTVTNQKSNSIVRSWLYIIHTMSYFRRIVPMVISKKIISGRFMRNFFQAQVRLTFNYSLSFFFNQNHKSLSADSTAYFHYLFKAFEPSNEGVISFRVSFV